MMKRGVQTNFIRDYDKKGMYKSMSPKEYGIALQGKRKKKEKEIGRMTNYKAYINALRECAKEHENDIIPFAHIRISELCRDTANLLEKLEQKSTLDKIRKEIEQINGKIVIEDYVEFGSNCPKYVRLEEVIKIIDKYKEGER